MAKKNDLVETGELVKKIYLIRGRRVMLDADIARLYEVETKSLVQAVKRNSDRFPLDFMFQLSWEEAEYSRSQTVTLKRGKNVKYRPHVFTEQGVAMLSGVLRSKRAVRVNVAIMRAFVKLRRIMDSEKGLARKLKELEGKYDAQFKVVFDAIRRLMDEPKKPIPGIGFKAKGPPEAN